MIISIGFRVNSKKAIIFRIWANKVIKDYMIQEFALNDVRFMRANKKDQEYFQRLLERIKLIRTIYHKQVVEKTVNEYEKCKVIKIEIMYQILIN